MLVGYSLPVTCRQLKIVVKSSNPACNQTDYHHLTLTLTTPGNIQLEGATATKNLLEKAHLKEEKTISFKILNFREVKDSPCVAAIRLKAVAPKQWR